MTTLTLRFTGPDHQARPALGGLLRRFPHAFFVERSGREYAVTADEPTAAELARQPQWQAQPVSTPARGR